MGTFDEMYTTRLVGSYCFQFMDGPPPESALIFPRRWVELEVGIIKYEFYDKIVKSVC